MFGENFGRAPCDWCPFPILSIRPNVPPEESVSHSRAWRRGRRGGAAVVACATVFFFSLGARGGRMTNGAIKSLGGPLFNTPPEVSHSPPPPILTFALPINLSPPNHRSKHPTISANIVTQQCNKPGIPFDKSRPKPDPPPFFLPNSEGTAAGGDSSGSTQEVLLHINSSGSAQEVLLHSPTGNNSGSAREVLLYKRSSHSAQARVLLKQMATEDGSSPLRCARARPKAPPYQQRALGRVSKLPTWRT